MPRAAGFFVLAAAAEIGGCFAFWAVLRQGRPAWWLGLGVALLVIFAWALTRVEVPAAGRAFAAYGGVYIAASLAWLWGVEGVRPDRWDLIGGAVCLAGAAIIFLGILLLFWDQVDLKIGVLTAIGDIVAGLVSFLFFSRVNAANDRMDRYHAERVEGKRFGMLLRACEGFDSYPEGARCRDQIIRSAAESWLVLPDGARARPRDSGE